MKLSSFLLALVLALPSFAQYDKKAKEILDKVSAQTKGYSTIKADFTYTHENIAAKIKETKNGSLFLKGNKYKMDFMGNSIFCDSKTIWNYIKESNEVNISNVNEKEPGLFNPSSMFTIYEKGFKYKLIRERFEKGIALYDIELYPENVKESEYSKIRLLIDKDKNQIHKVEYVAKDENRFIIEITSFKSNIPMEDTMFTFKKENFPNVEIIDMR
ncbi:MAG: outer membrane lipoprotein carrier protein LolA [Bacteroidales bacterium]